MAQPQAKLSRCPTLIGGYDVELKNSSSLSIYKCPICLLVMKEPYHLVTCPCGANFCRTCIEPVYSKKPSCPVCSSDCKSITPNVYLKLQIENERVFCKHRKDGCTWEGDLRNFESHLSDPSKLFGEKCQFHPESCKFCEKEILRKLLDEHQRSQCPWRPYQCTYCHQYETNYTDVVEKHVPVCDLAPARCPNEKCTVTGLKRKDLDAHVSQCPETLVKCGFVGCSYSCPRKNLGDHYQLSMSFHMGLIAKNSKEGRQDLERKMEVKIDSLRKDLDKALEKISVLTKNNNDMLRENAKAKVEIYELNLTIAALKGEIHSQTENEETLSQKIDALKVESQNNARQEKEAILISCSTKISEQVKRQVSHQLATIKREVKQENMSFVTDLNSKTDRKLHESFGIVYQEMHSLKDQMELSSRTSAGLRKNIDTLAARSTNARVQDVTKKVEKLEDVANITLSSQLGKHPVEVYLREFYKWNVGNEEWVSPPFYIDGYKLCLTAFVNGDPKQDAAGFFSLYAHIMKGNNDQKLSWPFVRMLILELVHNDSEVQNKKQNLPYTRDMSSKYNGRVNSSGKGKGWGFARFCSHGDLNKYFHGNPEYLVIRIT